MDIAQNITSKYVQAPGKVKKLIFGLIALAAVLFVFQWVNSPMIVTVTGSGEVASPAQSATMTFTLTGNADNPNDAISSLKGKVQRVKDTLKTSGITESDIYESQLAAYPASAVTEGGSGFTAVSTMGFKTVQVNNLDGIIAGLYAQGATLVSQPILTIDNTKDLESQAFDSAVSDAKKKANSIALRNFKFIKKIVLIEQTVSNPSTTVSTKADTATQLEKNISPDQGVLKVTKSVSVSYKMW